MKQISLVKSFALSAIAMVSLSVFGTQKVTEIDSPIDALFIPEGFDSNDNTEFVLSGNFPTSCFKTGPVTSEVDALQKTIILKPLSYQYEQNSLCAEARIPFTQVVKLGLLEEGVYTVSLSGNPDIKKTLHVKKNVSATPDDYLYAPVQSISVDKKSNKKTASLEIKGVFPRLFHGCMKLVDVKVELTNDVYVVLPIAEIAYNQDCINTPLEFKTIVSIPQTTAKKSLIHTRVTNGNSLNTIWEDGYLHHNQ